MKVLALLPVADVAAVVLVAMLHPVLQQPNPVAVRRVAVAKGREEYLSKEAERSETFTERSAYARGRRETLTSPHPEGPEDSHASWRERSERGTHADKQSRESTHRCGRV